MDKKKGSERRQSQRRRFQMDVFILFVNHHTILGRLIDISTDGLSFEYSNLGRREGRPEREESRAVIDLFSAFRKHFFLANLPCREVYDIKLETPSFCNMETRRCGVEFGRLSVMQSRQLGLILRDRSSLPSAAGEPLQNRLALRAARTVQAEGHS